MGTTVVVGGGRSILRGPGLVLEEEGRSALRESEKMQLERVIGNTVKNSGALAVSPATGDIAYPAGYNRGAPVRFPCSLARVREDGGSSLLEHEELPGVVIPMQHSPELCAQNSGPWRRDVRGLLDDFWLLWYPNLLGFLAPSQSDLALLF